MTYDPIQVARDVRAASGRVDALNDPTTPGVDWGACCYGQIEDFDDGWPKSTFHDLSIALAWVRYLADCGIEATIIRHPGHRLHRGGGDDYRGYGG